MNIFLQIKFWYVFLIINKLNVYILSGIKYFLEFQFTRLSSQT